MGTEVRLEALSQIHIVIAGGPKTLIRCPKLMDTVSWMQKFLKLTNHFGD